MRHHSHTFAFHSPNVTKPPAQLRTSCAKRLGSGFSYAALDLLLVELAAGPSTYNHAAIDPDNEVVPWLNGQFEVGVAQDLETKAALLVMPLLRRVAVQARDESIESVEHGSRGGFLASAHHL